MIGVSPTCRASSAASAARAVFVPARLRATQPGTLRCRLRPTASSPTPTSPVIVEPAATYAPSATATGCTSTESLPMNEYRPTVLADLVSPS